ncbi:unnamed protein product, partial [Adineta steineri]
SFIISFLAWTGTPAQPTAITQQPSTCSCGNQLPFVLSLLNTNFDPTNALYLWQSSPTGANTWSNLGTPSSLSPYEGAGQDSPSDYQCLILIQNPTPMIITSAIVTISSSYCPTFAMNCNQNAEINNFILAGDFNSIINDQATGCSTNGYKAPSETTVVLIADKNYMAQVSTGGDSTGMFITIWIDLNNNFLFENSEIISSTSLSGVSPGPITVNVPSSMVMGQYGRHRMRVMLTTINPVISCGQLNGIGETHDYNIQIIMAWTDTPALPTTTSNQPSTCSCRGQLPFTLSFSNANFDPTNAMYLWQSSPTGKNTWSNLGRPTVLPTYQGAGQNFPSDYQCQLLIQNPTPMIITSMIVTISNTYCPPLNSICDPSAGGDMIDTFTIVGEAGTQINDGGTGCAPNGYDNRTSEEVVLRIAGSYPISLSTGHTATSDMDRDFFAIWIDFNNDTIFTDQEIIASGNFPDNSNTAGFTLTVPSLSSTVQLGRFRMRVSVARGGLPNGCQVRVKFGETHDYMVQITDGWLLLPSMNHARSGHTASLLQSQNVLVIGGYDGTSVVNTAEFLDMSSSTWINTAIMQNARTNHTATVLSDGRVLVIGGSGSGPNSILNSVELYDPAIDQWTTRSPMTVPRTMHTASLLPGDQILVTGGMSNGVFINTTALYDVGANTWTTADHMRSNRLQHTASTLSSNRVLVAGGDTPDTSGTSELYQGTRVNRNSVSNMAYARQWHRASVLSNDQVLVTGGRVDSTNLYPTAAELYSQRTSKWSKVAAMTGARMSHTASVTNNIVVVAGGESLGFVLNTTEYYDTTNKKWHSAGHLIYARSKHADALFEGVIPIVISGTDGVNSLQTVEFWYGVQSLAP